MKCEHKDAQNERVKLYSERYSLGQDIFTGEPLEGVDFEERKKAESRKSRAAGYGFGHSNGFVKYVNNEVCD